MAGAMKARVLDEREAFRKCLCQRWDWNLDLNDEEIVAWRSGERAIQAHVAGTHMAGSVLGKTGEPWTGQRTKRKDQRGRQSQGHCKDKGKPWESLSKR